MKRKLFLLATWVLFFTVVSCDEDEPLRGDAAINNWIYENMNYFYYWTSEIPSKPNKSVRPDQFFESLLSNKDRFSWIEENYQELLKSLQGINKEAGFEFILYLDNQIQGNVLMQITYIKPNSPASQTALKRGDVIKAINGQTLTQTNYRTLLGQMGSTYTISYNALQIESNSFSSPNSLSLTPVEYSENPNHLASVITMGSKKVGYYVYTFFATGAQSNSSEYNNEMDEIFSEFKAEGITDLVLDLRYNSGGAETATRNLASLIAPGVTSSSIFAKRQYNAQINEEITNDPDLGPEFFLTRFLAKSQNVGNQLDNFIVLTGPRTASASELLINGLRPYMNVFLIGDVTFGKNVGSISLYEEDNPDNTWGMQPIVVKSFNVNDESDYSNGFTPDITLEDNSLFIYPLGDVNELLLSRALEVIAGQPASVERAKQNNSPYKALATSQDFKRIIAPMVFDTKSITLPVK